MLTNKIMRQLLLFFCSILPGTACFSQSSMSPIDDSTGFHSYVVFKGDTLLVALDSAYVLNKGTFKVLHDNYTRVKNGNTSSKELLTDYEHVIALQDSMLQTKEMYYQQLKGNFDSLIGSTNTFIQRTDMNITIINQSLTNATNELNNVKDLLDDALDKLKHENNQKFKLAAGAFTIGIGVAAIIFAIAK
jgi:hypothetical protein